MLWTHRILSSSFSSSSFLSSPPHPLRCCRPRKEKKKRRFLSSAKSREKVWFISEEVHTYSFTNIIKNVLDCEGKRTNKHYKILLYCLKSYLQSTGKTFVFILRRFLFLKHKNKQIFTNQIVPSKFKFVVRINKHFWLCFGVFKLV